MSAIPKNRAPPVVEITGFHPKERQRPMESRRNAPLFLSRRKSLALPATLVEIPRNLNGRTSRRKPSDSISQDSCHSCHSSLGILECSRTEYRSHNVEIDSEEPWRLIEFVAIPISIWEFVFEYSHRRMPSRDSRRRRKSIRSINPVSSVRYKMQTTSVDRFIKMTIYVVLYPLNLCICLYKHEEFGADVFAA